MAGMLPLMWGAEQDLGKERVQGWGRGRGANVLASTINASSTLASGKDQDMASRFCTLVVTQEITLATKGHLRTAGSRKGIRGSGLREGAGEGAVLEGEVAFAQGWPLPYVQGPSLREALLVMLLVALCSYGIEAGSATCKQVP